VSTLARGVAVLRSFLPSDRSLGVREIARRSRLPPSTAHRIVSELAALGLLERSGDGAVSLGLRLFELGQLVPRQRSLRDVALPFMEDLQHATRQTVHLAIRDETEVVYVEILGSRGTSLPSRVGGRMPLHCTGVGKAILAYSDPAVVRAVLEQPLVARAPATITEPGRLLAQLREVRRRGVAYDRQESGPGIVCAASPILCADGHPAGALSVTGRVGLMDVEQVAPAVHAVARALGRRLPPRI
jgi:IclR family acetate operon transcriptional repressor